MGWSGVLRKVTRHCQEFSKATTLHGLKYITEERRHWTERVLWLVTCCSGLLAAVYLIDCVWVQYTTSPTITSIESTHFPIWNIPFPAVTICNVNKVHLTAVRQLYRSKFDADGAHVVLHRGLNNTLKEDEYLGFVQQLAEIIQPEQASTFMELEKVLRKHNLTMEVLMQQLTQPCSSLLVKCKWRGQLVPCNSLYSMHKTDAGFCCSFNYRPPDKATSGEPLLHVNGAGYLAGVTMLMDPQLEDYYAALFSFYGLQVLVHSPTDYPEISARGIILAPQKEAFLQVSAAATYSTHRVRGLGVAQRQCMFQDERQLNMSSDNMNSTYSYSNCLIKCRLEHMVNLCNCTPYFYPDTGTTRQCGLTDVECLAQHRRVFINLRSPGEVPGLGDGNNSMHCDCHPTCTDVVYTTELSQGNFFKSEYDRTHFFKEVNITNHSILHVYFKDLSIIRFRRDVIYSWNDLLASFGGIVGLCLGCSLLSLVELVYYFTVRPTCAALRHTSATTIPVKTIKIAQIGTHPAIKTTSVATKSRVVGVPATYNWLY